MTTGWADSNRRAGERAGNHGGQGATRNAGRSIALRAGWTGTSRRVRNGPVAGIEVAPAEAR